MDYNEIIRENKIEFDILLSVLRTLIEDYNITPANRDETLIKINEKINAAETFINEKKDYINNLIDKDATAVRREGYEEKDIQKAIAAAKTMVTEMATEMNAKLKTIIDSQDQEAGKKLYHRKRKSSRKRKSRRNNKSTKRKRRHSKKK